MSQVVMSCIDDSANALAVIDCGAWASQVLKAPMRILHVIDNTLYPQSPNLSGNIGLGSYESLLTQLSELDEQRNKLVLTHSKELLRNAKARALAQGGFEPSRIGRHGDLRETLLELESQTRLLVMGKLGDQSPVIGSQVENVIRSLKCHILLVQPEFTAPQQAMIAFDGSHSSLRALQKVAESPLFAGMQIHLVMVEAKSDAFAQALEDQAKLLTTAGLSVQTALISGEVVPSLQAYGQEHGIDLLVMGAYGHSRIRQLLLGSTTSTMIRQSKQAVMVVR